MMITNDAGNKRTDSASRIIMASPEGIYQVFLDPKALVSWLPPKGMKGRIELFEPHEGGAFRITLTYEDADHTTPAKTSDHSDVVEGRFVGRLPFYAGESGRVHGVILTPLHCIV